MCFKPIQAGNESVYVIQFKPPNGLHFAHGGISNDYFNSKLHHFIHILKKNNIDWKYTGEEVLPGHFIFKSNNASGIPSEYRDTVSEPSDLTMSIYKRHLHIKLDERSIKRVPNIELFHEVKSGRKLVKRKYPTELEDINLGSHHETTRDISEIKDPLFAKQWHLLNKDYPHADINVTGLWGRGIVGHGVTIAIIDDGLDLDHPDLSENVNLNGSWDFNNKGPKPMPRLKDDNHGTRCAGEIAAVKNDVCGVGVAWKAKVSGIRLLSGAITDIQEVNALTHRNDINYIYSCSWGPSDNGRTVEAPNTLLRNAFITGVVNGRQGLGSIYVFASGNGGARGDNCNYDGYTNSIFTITVAAIDYRGNHPKYSESCSAVLTSSFGHSGLNAGYTRRYICTTDRHKKNQNSTLCTTKHRGTSAAAPLVSGIVGLLLSHRKDLSWRDVQHLIVRSSVKVQTENKNDGVLWETNGAGFSYSNEFGFGKLDASKLIELASTWSTVGGGYSKRYQNPKDGENFGDHDERKTNSTTNQKEMAQVRYYSGLIKVDQDIPQGKAGIEVSNIVGRQKINDIGLLSVEHVTVTITLDHRRRGDLEYHLISPQGTRSILSKPRIHDRDSSGLTEWTMMSVKHWGESAVGEWKLKIIDNLNPRMTGRLKSWKIDIFGADVYVGKTGATATPVDNDDPITDIPDGNNNSVIGKSSAVLNVLFVFCMFIFSFLVIKLLLQMRKDGTSDKVQKLSDNNRLSAFTASGKSWLRYLLPMLWSSDLSNTGTTWMRIQKSNNGELDEMELGLIYGLENSDDEVSLDSSNQEMGDSAKKNERIDEEVNEQNEAIIKSGDTKIYARSQ